LVPAVIKWREHICTYIECNLNHCCAHFYSKLTKPFFSLKCNCISVPTSYHKLNFPAPIFRGTVFNSCTALVYFSQSFWLTLLLRKRVNLHSRQN
jgi:lipopolysaccharide export LptBFGC system permease protein LptF